MKNLKRLTITAALLAAIWTVPAGQAQSKQPPTNSVPSSPSSDTRAGEVVPGSKFRVPSKRTDTVEPTLSRNSELETRNSIAACMATAVELEKSRVLVEAIETENALLIERLETERQTNIVLTELNQTRKNEAEALRASVAAKDEAITAKDAVIASQDKLMEALKKKKPSPWRRVGDILIGAAAGMILR